MPVLSPGFEIETELSIHAVDKRWRIAEVPIDYRDRPEGSESKLNTFSDGMKVLAMIMSLFKDYRPLALFSWLALLFCLLGSSPASPSSGSSPRRASYRAASHCWPWPRVRRHPRIRQRLILDTVVKGTRKEYELQVTQAYERLRQAQGVSPETPRGARVLTILATHSITPRPCPSIILANALNNVQS